MSVLCSPLLTLPRPNVTGRLDLQVLALPVSLVSLLTRCRWLLRRSWELLNGTGVTLSSSLHPSAAGAASPAGISDELLVKRWQEGHRDAFEALVRRYQHVAFTVCFRQLGSRELAEETAQDVFITLFRKLGDYRGDASFKSWFYRVLVNHCHNRHKARVRRKSHLHDSIDSAADPDQEDRRPRELVDPRLSPEQATVEHERQLLIERALQTLDEEARMILLLREGEGMSYEDIGSQLDLPAGTVKSRLFRSRAALKEAVDRLRVGEPVR